MPSEIKLLHRIKLIHFHVDVSIFALVQISSLKIIFSIHVFFLSFIPVLFQFGLFQTKTLAQYCLLILICLLISG